MGFPTGYPEDLLPDFLTLSFLGFIPILILTLLRLLGLPHFLQPIISRPAPGPDSRSLSGPIIHELLPVIKFADVGAVSVSVSEWGYDLPDTCRVCLCEFEDHEEIRRLTNCGHIFHRVCMDRWIMEHNQRSCPLCRNIFIPDYIAEALNQKVGHSITVSDQFDFGSEFIPINTFL